MGISIGVDVGGSHVSAAVFDGTSIVERTDVRFAPRSKGENVVETIRDAVHAVWQSRDPLPPVGVGVPGIITSSRFVELAPNLGLRAYDMREALGAVGITAQVINDANAAALGEWSAGAGKGSDSLVCVTVGTGIGSGVVLSGRPVIGSFGRAGEIGHMTVAPGGPVCSCGHRGCLESLASATAITRDARKAIEEGDPGLTRVIYQLGLPPERIAARHVFEAMRQGSKAAAEIIEAAATWLGVALANVVVTFDPDLIVIGGGISQAGDAFLHPVRQAMKANVVCALRDTPVVQASLGTDAGVIGAAVYAAQS